AWRRSAAAPEQSSSWVAGRRPRCSPKSPGGAPASSCSCRWSSRSYRRTARRRARCSRAALPHRRQCSPRRCRFPPRTRRRRRRPRRARNPPTRARRPIADLHPAYVLLEDGAWFPGTAPRAFEPTYAEVVFTTNLSGYQEVFTDPSYLGQIVVMTASMIGLDLATQATIGAEYTEGPADAHRHIVAYDYGMKRNILRLFLKNGCRVTVIPAATPAARVRELAPDGLFLSNGPGDPAAVS